MKIMKDLVQGSTEWLTFRRSHIGASDAATIMEINPYQCRDDLLKEKILGLQKVQNYAMKRGSEMEIEARFSYELETGLHVMPLVAEDDIFPFLSASFDGITKCLSGVVEIKCGKFSHSRAERGEIPPYYMAQLQHQMMIADVDLIDYWSWNGRDGILFTIEKDTHFISEMLDKEFTFWQDVTSLAGYEGIYAKNEAIRAF